MVKFNDCACPLKHLIINKYLKLHYSKDESNLLIMDNFGIKLLKGYRNETTKQKVEDQEEW